MIYVFYKIIIYRWHFFYGALNSEIPFENMLRVVILVLIFTLPQVNTVKYKHYIFIYFNL